LLQVADLAEVVKHVAEVSRGQVLLELEVRDHAVALLVAHLRFEEGEFEVSIISVPLGHIYLLDLLELLDTRTYFALMAIATLK
jgi:hypothetical protein